MPKDDKENYDGRNVTMLKFKDEKKNSVRFDTTDRDKEDVTTSLYLLKECWNLLEKPQIIVVTVEPGD